MKKRALFIFISLACVIGAIMVYSFFIKESYQMVQEIRAEVFSKKEAISRYTLSAQKMQSLVEQYESVGNARETLSRILPLKKDPRFVVAQVAGLARLGNVNVESLSMSVAPNKSSQSPALNSLGVFTSDIRVAGSYEGVKKFMTQIDNNIIPFVPEAITLRIERREGQTPFLVMEGLFENYYQVTQ